MDIKELKKLLKNSTSVLILDGGEPAFVILDYSVYRRLSEQKNDEHEIKIRGEKEPHKLSQTDQADSALLSGADLSRQDMDEASIIDRLNREISALKQQIEAEERHAAE